MSQAQDISTEDPNEPTDLTVIDGIGSASMDELNDTYGIETLAGVWFACHDAINIHNPHTLEKLLNEQHYESARSHIHNLLDDYTDEDLLPETYHGFSLRSLNDDEFIYERGSVSYHVEHTGVDYRHTVRKEGGVTDETSGIGSSGLGILLQRLRKSARRLDKHEQATEDGHICMPVSLFDDFLSEDSFVYINGFRQHVEETFVDDDGRFWFRTGEWNSHVYFVDDDAECVVRASNGTPKMATGFVPHREIAKKAGRQDGIVAE